MLLHRLACAVATTTDAAATAANANATHAATAATTTDAATTTTAAGADPMTIATIAQSPMSMLNLHDTWMTNTAERHSKFKLQNEICHFSGTWAAYRGHMHVDLADR